MWVFRILFAIVLTIPQLGWAEPSAPFSHVRSLEADILKLIDDGVARSATFRALVKAILATDGIVYVERGACGHGVRACLMSVSAAGAYRVLRIRVKSATPDDRLIATIGHELQHALEILADRTITTTEGMQQFYLRRGSRRSGGAIETEEAAQAGQAVRAELASGRFPKRPR